MDGLPLVPAPTIAPGPLQPAAGGVREEVVQCPHQGCVLYIARSKLEDHKLECPRAECVCTIGGCDFTGPAMFFLCHVDEVHKCRVELIPYGEPFYCQLPVPAAGSKGVMSIFYGTDSSMFALVLLMFGPCPIVSVVCMRPAMVTWPRFTAKLHVIAPPASPDFTMDAITGVFEPTSCPAPGKLEFQDIKTFVTVPPKFVNNTGNAQVNIWVSIKMKDSS